MYGLESWDVLMLDMMDWICHQGLCRCNILTELQNVKFSTRSETLKSACSFWSIIGTQLWYVWMLLSFATGQDICLFQDTTMTCLNVVLYWPFEVIGSCKVISTWGSALQCTSFVPRTLDWYWLYFHHFPQYHNTRLVLALHQFFYFYHFPQYHHCINLLVIWDLG